MKIKFSVLAFLLILPGLAFGQESSGVNTQETVPGLMQMIEDGSFEMVNPWVQSAQEIKVLTIDTKNQRVCKNISQKLYETGRLSEYDYKHLCDYSEQGSFASVYLPPATDIRRKKFSDLSPREQKLAKQTRNYIPLMIGMMAVLHALPESATGWDKFEWEGVKDRWIENTNAGPEKDPDDGFFNYFAHPYVGSGYYQVARHEGFSPLASFAYSAFMSTVLWEYGIEAVSAVPSTQDLIITPVVGSLLGELFFQWSKKIENNGGKLMGSKGLGNFARFVLHPAGTLLEYSNELFPEEIFEDAEGYFYMDWDHSRNSRFNLGVKFYFKRH